MADPVDIGPFQIGRVQQLCLIAGPCVIESRAQCLEIAARVSELCKRLQINYVFKASFDKANRTSAHGFRGPGLDAGLEVLAAVRQKTAVPVLTDVHVPEQAEAIGRICDIIQIPAFLCRQTDLLIAAAGTGKPVNIKKGQFMAPEQMAQAAAKVRESGNGRILITERGTFFGYGRLVNDLTCIPVMQEFAPVVFDATHSCQLPGGEGDRSGGLRRYVPLLARAGIAAGADALFLEVHDRPDQARSDASTVFPLGELETLLALCLRVRNALDDPKSPIR